jgi:hypothetical protein
MVVRTKPEITRGSASLLRVAEGGTFTLSVGVSDASIPVTYQWALEGRNIVGAAEPTYTVRGVSASDAGRYVCVVSNPCGTDVSNVTEVRTYREDPTSVDADGEGASTVSIDPNPSNGPITVRFTLAGASRVSIHVTDVAGRIVHTRTLDAMDGENALTIRPNDIGAAGVYTLTIDHAGGRLARRFVVTP